MKLQALLLLLALPLIAAAQDVRWKKDRPLEWKDFKGTPDEDGPHIAATNSRIKYSFYHSSRDTLYQQISFKVECLFNCDRSWVKNGHRHKDVLRHEQLHFDISELYARILYDAFSKAKFTANYRIEIQALYDEINKSRKDMQHKYDEQVAHGNTEMPEVWEQHIHDEMARLPPNY